MMLKLGAEHPAYEKRTSAPGRKLPCEKYCVAGCSARYDALRSSVRGCFDFGLPGTTNTPRQTLSAVSRKPRKLRGFRVLAVDFSPTPQCPVWRKIRHNSLSVLRPCGLLDCQVHTMVFVFPFRSARYVWSRESGFMASMPAERNVNPCGARNGYIVLQRSQSARIVSVCVTRLVFESVGHRLTTTPFDQNGWNSSAPLRVTRKPAPLSRGSSPRSEYRGHTLVGPQ